LGADRGRHFGLDGVESEAEFAFAGLHQLLRPVLGWLDRIPDHMAAALRRAVGVDPVGRAAPMTGSRLRSLCSL
jgi:hypothetical protein